MLQFDANADADTNVDARVNGTLVVELIPKVKPSSACTGQIHGVELSCETKYNGNVMILLESTLSSCTSLHLRDMW